LPLFFFGHDLIEPSLEILGNRRLANLPIA
jgi:hypothetical protein